MPPASDWRRLHPLSPLLRAGRFVVLVAAFLADEIADRLAVGGPWLSLLLLGAVAVGAVVAWWAWRSTRYRVTTEEVELRTGVLFRRYRRLPLARLESVDITRPLFARVFGLAQVRLEAVSDVGTEVRLSYLDDAAALRLRDELRAGAAPTDGPAPVPPPGGDGSASGRALRLPTRELVLGILGSRLAVAWAVGLAGMVAILATMGPVQALAFGPAAALAPVVVGLVEFERQYGFTLRDSPGDLHISRGLLNELHQQVPAGRIQAVSVVEPLLWRPWRRARLVVDVAGYRGGKSNEREHSSVLLPIAPLPVVLDVVERVRPGLRLDRVPYVRAPAAARWRVPVRWRAYAVAWDAHVAIVRRGLLRRRTDVVAHVKVQSLRVTQGPWQRALGLATLHLDTAGAQIRARAPHRSRGEAERLAWASREAASVSPGALGGR
jgi:putative membrane protein